MPLTCPICGVTNDRGPNCRRCRADVSLCFAVERQRGHAVTAARLAAVTGNFEAGHYALRRAEALRRGDDLRPIEAALHLLNGEHEAAWNCFRIATRVES